jgi:hypothetical protein
MCVLDLHPIQNVHVTFLFVALILSRTQSSSPFGAFSFAAASARPRLRSAMRAPAALWYQVKSKLGWA